MSAVQPSTRIRRAQRFVSTRLREWRMIAWGLASSDHPVLAHVIPIRRCNLSCTYCNEYDDFLEARAARRDVAARGQAGGAGRLHHHPERRRAAAASRTRSDHRPRAPSRTPRRHDHQRLPAHRRPHPPAQSRRARSSANQHRQRQARRNLEEKPEGSGPEAGAARGTRRISGQHQFGARQRRQRSRRRFGSCPPRARTRLHQHRRRAA